MFCQCYDVAEQRGDPALPPWRTDILQARIDKALARELKRVVVVQRGPRPALLVYPEGTRAAPFYRVSLDSVELSGEPNLLVRIQPRDDNAALLLRFETLEAKINWWRAVAQLTTPSSYETADELDQVTTTAISEEDSDGDIDEDASMVKKTRQAFEQAVQAFVRPPRARYDISQLGPRAFPFGGKAYRRQDATCANKRGEVVRYSVWRGVDQTERKTLVYVHANAGCRLEALSVLGPCLQMGFQVIALDCAGSGLSGGEHTTLGWRERDDVRAVIDAEDCGQVTLWGRSMGAATALLYAATRDPNVTALILDSPFQSLRQLALDVVQAALGGSELNGAARVASIGALRLVRGAVRRRAGFDIYDVDVERHARECACPTLVLCALDDALVPPAHSHAVHAALPHAELCVCPGTHNSVRPRGVSQRVERFLREHVFGEAQASSGDVEGLLDEAVVSPTLGRGPMPPWHAEALATRARATAPRFLGSFDEEDLVSARRVDTPDE